MGSGNVAKVYAYGWARELSHREMVALLFMALHAKDPDSPPRYFASRSDLADALGLDGNKIRAVDEHASGTDAHRDAVKASKPVQEQLRRVLTRLEGVGAIQRAPGVHAGRGGECALNLTRDSPATFKRWQDGRGVWEVGQRPPETAGQGST